MVVGSGPVGVRFVQELHRRDPSQRVVLYNSEHWAPYNRVKLTAFLAGDIDAGALANDPALAPEFVELRPHCSVIDIHADRREVIDATGRVQPYSRLVLATGSRARIPDIPGIGQQNVFGLRSLSDVHRLQARQARSRDTLVLGGGLLGLEAARALHRMGTRVTLVDHNPRLLMNQLDDRVSRRLLQHVEKLGINVVLGDPVSRFHGEGRVTAASLRSGIRLACDTVVVAAGIRAVTELAVLAGVAIGRGIRVDDRMRSSNPDILAIGECAEHRERTYGLVAPGFEQAAVAAHEVAGADDRAAYTGSLDVSRLKVLDLPVFSIGRVTERDRLERAATLRYRSDDGTIERALVLEDGILVGAMAVGPCPEAGRLQEAVLLRRKISLLQKLAFRREGLLWPEAEIAVASWPAEAVVCQCNGVTRGALTTAMTSGCNSVDALAACTRASTVCGSCRPLLVELLGQPPVVAAPRAQRPLLVAALLALLLALALHLLPGLPYVTSVQGGAGWDPLWRDNFYKQVSGYSVVALAMAGLLISLRKRMTAAGTGLLARLLRTDFAGWRLAHVVLGLLALLALWVHTGGRSGHHLDAWLLAAFGLALLTGAATGTLAALEQRMTPRVARRWRARGFAAHTWPLWPVPALLCMHIFKTYFY